MGQGTRWYLAGLLLSIVSVSAYLWWGDIALSSLFFLPLLLFFMGWPLVGLLGRWRRVPAWYAPLLALLFGAAITAAIASVEFALTTTVELTILLASTVAAVLNAVQLILSVRAPLPVERTTAPRAPRDRKRLVAASCFVVLLILVAYAIVQPFPSKPLTEFYLLNDEGFSSELPYQMGVNETALLTVGIANHEGRPVQYHVQVWLAQMGDATDPASTEAMYYLDTWSVQLDSVPMPLSGQWSSQYERDLNFTAPLDGTFRLWFFLFFDEVPAGLGGLTPLVDYQNEQTLSLIERSQAHQLLGLSIHLDVTLPAGG